MSDGYRAFFVSFIGKSVFVVFFLQIFVICSFAGNISDKTYLIALVNSQNCNNQSFWDAIQNNNESGLEIEVTLKSGNIYLKNSNEKFSEILKKINKLVHTDASKTLPVFVHFGNNITLLDSIINASEIASSLFFLPQDEAWPTEEYLIQANRRVIFFVDGNFTGTSRILHPVANYALSISATEN